MQHSRLFAATVVHTRYTPVHHSFNYPVYYYIFDLDELEGLSKSLYSFGYNKSRPVSIWDQDYVISHNAPAPLKEQIDPTWSIKRKLLSYVSMQGTQTTNITRVELVTTPRFMGRSFNPVSFYFCYDNNSDLVCFVAEVNNTFGERHIYVLPSSAKLELDAKSSSKYQTRFVAGKSFHVSPFNDVSGLYEFKLSDISERLQVNINQLDASGARIMATYLIGQKPYYPLTDGNILWMLVKFPLSAMLTFPRITYEAFQLHFKKRMPVYAKPPPHSNGTIGLIEASWAQKYAQSQVMPALAHLLDVAARGSVRLHLPDKTSLLIGTGPQSLDINVLSWEFFIRLFERGCSIAGLIEAFVGGDFESKQLFDVISRSAHIRPSLDLPKDVQDSTPEFGYLVPLRTSDTPRPPPFIRQIAKEDLTKKVAKLQESLQTTSKSNILFVAAASTVSTAAELACLTKARFTFVCSEVDSAPLLNRLKEAQLDSNCAILTMQNLIAKLKRGKQRELTITKSETPFSHVVFSGSTWSLLVGETGSFDALTRLVKLNTTRGSNLVIELQQQQEPIASASSQPLGLGSSRWWSPIRAWNSLSYKYDKLKEHFAGELLDVITTYVLNPFQVEDRVKELCLIHGFDAGFSSISETAIFRKLGATLVRIEDLTAETSKDLIDDISYVNSWWNSLKAQNLPNTDAAFRWSCEELRLFLFARAVDLCILSTAGNMKRRAHFVLD